MKSVICKYCKKPIFWVTMRESNKNMPLNCKLDGDPKKTMGIQVNFETMTGFRVDVYQPHFGKCTSEGRKGLTEEYND